MKKIEKLLIDTSALIEYMRGNRQAKELINSVDIAERYLPHIATAELIMDNTDLGNPARICSDWKE